MGGCCGTNANTCIYRLLSPCSDTSASEKVISARLRWTAQETKNEALRVKLSERVDTSPQCRVEKLPAHLYILDGGAIQKSQAGLSLLFVFLAPRGTLHHQPKSCTWMRSSALHLPSLRYKSIRDLRCKSHFIKLHRFHTQRRRMRVNRGEQKPSICASFLKR
jgi:hypothetical protein